MRVKTSWILLSLPTTVAGLILIVILNWHLPTHIKVTLNTDRVVFKVGGEDKSTILNSEGLQSVVIEKFESLKLRPESLTLITRGNNSGVASNRPAGPTAALTVTQQPVVITAKEGRSQSNVTISGVDSGQRALLSMDSVRANPSSEVTLENTDDPEDLIVRIDGQQSNGKITVAQPIKLAIDQCDISGINNLNSGEPLTFAAKLSRDSSLEFNGEKNSLVLTLTVPAERATSLFPQGRIPVAAIKFERLDDQSGKILSSLLKNQSCEITYPDYGDKIDKITVTNPDFLSLDYLQSFNVEEITYKPERKGLSMTLQGVADKVTSGSSDYVKDHRLTVYNAIWHNYKAVAFFAVLCWVAGTTAGFYKVFKGK